MKLTGRQLMKISALADKLDIKIDTKADIEDMGSDIIWQALRRAHTAEDEVSEVFAMFLGCKPKDALDIDLMEKWNEFKDSDKGKKALNFLQSVSGLKVQS